MLAPRELVIFSLSKFMISSPTVIHCGIKNPFQEKVKASAVTKIKTIKTLQIFLIQITCLFSINSVFAREYQLNKNSQSLTVEDHKLLYTRMYLLLDSNR